MNYGPTYNPLNKHRLPILGAWEASPTLPETDALSPELVPLTSFVPLEGPVILNSVWLDHNNDIQYTCGFKQNFCALLFKEDFEVCEQLILKEDEPFFPSFEYADEGREKSYDPAWLAETDFGRTLYACHHFLSELVFRTDKFDITPKEKFFNPSWHDPVKDTINYIPVIASSSNLCLGRHAVRIVPLEFNAQTNGKIDFFDSKNTDWKIDKLDMDMTFEIFDKETNDAVEPISSFFFKHREMFPQLIPNFERLRQMFILIYSLNAIRDSGYSF
jgi:hypothetical protein